MRVSVLDLGSNSFHVLVADAEEDGALVPVLREREMLHLGAVVAEHGHVPEADRDRAVDVVAHLTELARRSGAERQLAVATSALRDARNGRAVLAGMETAGGVAVRLLDGLEEARLAYLGVRASVAVTAEPTLVLDLGGGSLEFAVGAGTDLLWAASTDLGVSRLSAGLDRDPLRRRDADRLRGQVEREVQPLLATIRDLAPHTVVAVGGTVRALARVLAARTGTWLPATVNQTPLGAGVLGETAEELQGLDLTGRTAVPGMKSRRADRAHVAATVLHRTVELLGVDRVLVSDWGLREGTILEAVGADRLPRADELRTGAVRRFRRAFTLDDAHAAHVARLALRLFDGTTDVHGLGPADRELLEHAAMLHDIGRSIALRRYHQHGAYLVEHAEMRGFSPDEAAMLTTLVRFHSSRGTSTSHAPFAAMSPADRDRAERLLALLQVADGLDRARDQGVRDLGFQRRDGRLELVLHGTGLGMARTEVERSFALFRRTFAMDLGVVDRLGAGG